DLGRRADRRAEDRRTACQRLDGDEAEALELAGRQHERVRRAVVGGQMALGHEAEEPDVIGQAERDRERLEYRAKRAGASDEQEHARKALPHGGHRSDQRVEAHARLEVAEREQERTIDGPPERPPLDFLRALRMESLDVGSAHDLDDPISIDAIEIPEKTRREITEDLDTADSAERHSLERPEQERSSTSNESATVQARHAAPRSVLERRRGVKRVEARKATPERRRENTERANRLMEMENVGAVGRHRRLDRPSRAQYRRPHERGQRPSI